MSTNMSYVNTRKAAGLLDSTFYLCLYLRRLQYDKWMHRFGQNGIGLHNIDEHLGLEAGTYDGQRRNSTSI
jgi:hypothetical protein